ncbi:MAG: rubrerythrin [Nitrospirae bacterium]|nr:rubrerythrin [Nitrospirota bacterium]
MDIYEYAMQMEKDGEAYYRDLAAKTANKGIKHILVMLADAEVIHYRIFSAMKKREQLPSPDAQDLSGIKNIFERLKEEDTGSVDASQIALYRKAQDIEQKSRDFYLEQAEKSKDTGEKTAFLKIAQQEKTHFLILEKIIEFVNKPNIWLEDPEWYHLEEY